MNEVMSKQNKVYTIQCKKKKMMFWAGHAVKSQKSRRSKEPGEKPQERLLEGAPLQLGPRE